MADWQPTAGESAASDRLGYFIVRIRRSPADPPGQLSGLVEQLGTGEKRQFRTAEELARVVEEWSR